MTNKKLSKYLNKKNALVVHFSHEAIMREGGIFPRDLQNAIACKDKWNLSCCVVWPGHRMQLPGSVGVIFEPNIENVISVSSNDSGSTNYGGIEQSSGSKLDQETLDSTFSPTGPYNEWRVNGASVKGIFISNLHAIHVKQKKIMQVGTENLEIICAEPVDISYIFESFPAYNIFTYSGSSLVKLCLTNRSSISRLTPWTVFKLRFFGLLCKVFQKRNLKTAA